MDFDDIYEKYDKIKELKEYMDYENEMATNRHILNSYPFEEAAAKEQIKYLVSKYNYEINAVAFLLKNGMYTTMNPPLKNQFQIWNDLDYLNKLIPLFALERTYISNLLKKYVRDSALNE